jgi:hypothetical protein
MAIRNSSGSLQQLHLARVGVTAAPVVGCPMTVFTVIGFVHTTLLMLCSSSNGQFTAYYWLDRTFRGQVCRQVADRVPVLCRLL